MQGVTGVEPLLFPGIGLGIISAETRDFPGFVLIFAQILSTLGLCEI